MINMTGLQFKAKCLLLELPFSVNFPKGQYFFLVRTDLWYHPPHFNVVFIGNSVSTNVVVVVGTMYEVTLEMTVIHFIFTWTA
jgi:hypothetical protein